MKDRMTLAILAIRHYVIGSVPGYYQIAEGAV